jgi:hypothetical protein
VCEEIVVAAAAAAAAAAECVRKMLPLLLTQQNLPKLTSQVYDVT